MIAAVLGMLCTLPRTARADGPSKALQNVLSEMRGLSPNDFSTLVSWARNGTPVPGMTAFQPQQTENDILQLGQKDQQAVLWWLQGNGRSGLYARGASDYLIGPPRPLVDGPAPTPTPGPWRNIPLATATLNGNVQGNIQIIGGFAGARRDGTSAIACVSFTNLAPKTANRIVFTFTLSNAAGVSLGTLTLDRRGEFSPNIPILTFDNFDAWIQGSIGPRGRIDNCIQQTLGTAALPILQARVAGYAVSEVDYDDGTTWSPAQP